MSDSSSDFTFVIGDRRYLCPSSVAEYLPPGNCHIHCRDPAINRLRPEVDDPDKLVRSVLNGARAVACQSIQGIGQCFGRSAGHFGFQSLMNQFLVN
jgi:hypothetical protein